MSAPAQIIINSCGQTAIEKLWQGGYTIARRPTDPTNIRADEVPATRAYQWMHLEHDRVMYEGRGWAPVPYSRHPGRFAPWGVEGNIEWNGLGLFEKPKFEVEAEQAANHAKAHQNVDDWVARNGAEFSGFVHTQTQTKVGAVDDEDAAILHGTKTIETTTQIPRDMIPHIAAIMDERDRLVTDATSAAASPSAYKIKMAYEEQMLLTPDAPKWPTLHAIALPYAIHNVRTRITQEASRAT